MTERIPEGTWVEIRRVVLEPGRRAPGVPEDTQRVALELRVRGRLVQQAALGEQVAIGTHAGRRLRGELSDASPAYRHGFGAPVPELTAAAQEARALLDVSRRSDSS